MESSTPAEGRWVDVGSGLKVYDSKVTQDIIADTPVRVRTRAVAKSIHFKTPRKPGREPLGLETPPPSRRKQHSEFIPWSSKASCHEYPYKLKVPDSQGRKLPKVVFRWLV